MSSFNMSEAVQYVASSDPTVCPPLLLMGDMGIGKSAVAKIAAEVISARTGKPCRVIDIRLATCDAGDIKGMPKVDGAVMTFAKPSWTPFHEDYVKSMADLGKAVQGLGDDEWCILMFDELNRAPRDSQQAVFQMIYDRTNDDVPLSDRCIIMSAINDNSDVYQTTRLDPALIDRFFVVKFSPTDSEWLKYMSQRVSEGKVHPAVPAFLASNPTYIDPSSELIEKSTDTNTKVFSRRSWTRLGELIMHYETKVLMKGITEWDRAFIARLASGMVGDEAGLKFGRFVENDYQTLSPKDVVHKYDKAMSARIRKGRPDELASMVDEVVKILGSMTSDEKVWTTKVQGNLFWLYVDLPDEIAKKMSESWQAMNNKDRSTPAIITWMRRSEWGSAFKGITRYDDNGVAGKVYKKPLERHSDIHIAAPSK